MSNEEFGRYLLSRHVWMVGGEAYDGVLKSYARERRGGHKGEIRLRGSQGKPKSISISETS